MTRILILSFYYTPDLGAGSFRCSALVEHLSRYDTEIEVITAAPNRYATFIRKAPKLEQNKNVRVRRVEIPSHNNGIFDQIQAFITFYNTATKLVEQEDYDLVFATSSRLFTAFLGARISKKKKLPLYLDIRDIFLDTITDVLPSKIGWLAWPVLSLIEKYTFGSATHINLVSEGFAKYFDSRYRNSTYSFFTNGIDQEFIEASPKIGLAYKSKPIINVLYAGNIGKGQGLHKVIPKLAKALENQVQFRIIGDGAQRHMLENAIVQFGLNNVELMLPMSREELIEEYFKADVLFLHLNDYPAFEKVLPSKLFEYAAMGKPIWAGLKGYSAHFARSEITNSEVFSPGYIDDAIVKFKRLKFDLEPRVEFVRKFNREYIMNEMAIDILRVAKGNG